MTQGEAAVHMLKGLDPETNAKCDGAPKWIVWGDLDLIHRVRALAGLPQMGPGTSRLVFDALGKYAAKDDTELAVVGYDRHRHWRYFGLKPKEPTDA